MVIGLPSDFQAIRDFNPCRSYVDRDIAGMQAPAAGVTVTTKVAMASTAEPEVVIKIGVIGIPFDNDAVVLLVDGWNRG